MPRFWSTPVAFFRKPWKALSAVAAIVSAVDGADIGGVVVGAESSDILPLLCPTPLLLLNSPPPFSFFRHKQPPPLNRYSSNPPLSLLLCRGISLSPLRLASDTFHRLLVLPSIHFHSHLPNSYSGLLRNLQRERIIVWITPSNSERERRKRDSIHAGSLEGISAI